MYDLSGTWSEITHRFFDKLRLATEHPQSVDAFVSAALALLVGACSARTRDAVPPADVERFVLDSTAALLAQRVEIGVYVAETVWKTEEARDDEWYMLCMRRSALQVLIDDYPNTPLGSRVAQELPHLDDELRRVGEEQGPIEPRHVVALPTSHWWWHFPPRDLLRAQGRS